jgi:hypothetical protein
MTDPGGKSARPSSWQVPESARASVELLRVWGEVVAPLHQPICTHRSGLGIVIVWMKHLIRRLVRPVVEESLMQQAAWNSEILRRIVELEMENRELRTQVAELRSRERASN